MPFSTILVSHDEGVATITLNRPERLNAMNEMMAAELVQAIDEIAADDAVRVVLLTGAGRAFCAGADIGRAEGREAVLDESHPETIRRQLSTSAPLINLKLQKLEKPTIAMVNGPAVGAGFGWTLGCDMRFGSEKTRFRVAFTTIGLVPGTGDAWLLPRIVGVAKAAELLYSGDFVEGEEAYRIGLLNRLVPHEKLEEETRAFARRLAQNPPVSLRLNKILLYKGLDTDIETAMHMVAAYQAICINTQDHKEGVAAFREKRQPRFTGR
ncbi:MAG: enoyl-CoA hydratase-related protein [Dehalococcoidia bacterium]